MKFSHQIKCSNCGNQFPSDQDCNTCKHTKIKEKENPSQKIEVIEIDISGKPIRIEYSHQKEITVFLDGKNIPLKSFIEDVPFYKFSSLKQIEVHKAEILGHQLRIEYREPKLSFGSWGLESKGFSVKIDGKPPVGSFDHPTERIKQAASALFLIVGTQVLVFIAILIMGGITSLFVIISFVIFSAIFVALALCMEKVPRFSTGLGFILTTILITNSATKVLSSIESSTVIPLMWMTLLVGVAFVLLRGFFAAVRMKHGKICTSILMFIILFISMLYPAITSFGFYILHSMETSIWQEFRSDEFGFVAQFPSTPTHISKSVPTQDTSSPLVMDIFIMERWQNGTSYGVSYYKEPERNQVPKKDDAVQQIMGSLDGMAKSNTNGQLVSHSFSIYNGYPSADFVISFSDPLGRNGFIRGREILVEEGLYVTMVASTSSQEADAQRFIDSFRLLRENASIE